MTVDSSDEETSDDVSNTGANTTDERTDPTPRPGVTGSTSRRTLLRATGASSMTGVLSFLLSRGVLAEEVDPDPVGGREDVFRRNGSLERETVFPESVASGDPTSSGVILWTRIAPEAYRSDALLGVEVATNEGFDDVVYRGIVPASAVEPGDDFTVKADLDGELEPNEFYSYRFYYRGVTSRIGRCRTLPAPDESPDDLRIAVATCQDFSNGYYGAFSHIAGEDVDYLVHLGDAIYEYAVPDSAYEGRDVVLPSGEEVAYGLEDFRYLHRRYRSDAFYQRALERHTVIATWDDHEIVNNRWWEYDREPQRPASTSHPENDDREFMQRLFAAGIKSWWEYTPARIAISEELENYGPDRSDAPEGDDLHREFRLYRSFAFGDLLELAMTDERLYRTDPPGEAENERGTGPYSGTEDPPDSPERTMLGTDQREWFLDFLEESDATWTVWGNEVLVAPLRYADTDEASLSVNYDAWDGYRAERQEIAAVADENVENFVALTGDMHSSVAGYLLRDYESSENQSSPPASSERIGVEFMTPAISSANLVEATREDTPSAPTGTEIFDLPFGAPGELFTRRILSENPHLEHFDSSRWGYSIVEFTPEDATYIAYDVDKDDNSPQANRETLVAFRTPAGSDELTEVTAEYTPAEPTTDSD